MYRQIHTHLCIRHGVQTSTYILGSYCYCAFSIGEGPKHVEQNWELFHFLEIVTGWLVPSAGPKILVQPGWYLPPQNILLVENRFLQGR